MDLFTSTTIALDNDSKDRWQTVYISQAYGTLFVVYALLNFDTSNNEINHIKLKLINYKGPINMGIVSAKHLPNRYRVRIQEFDEDGNPVIKYINTCSIELELKALVQNTRTDVQANYPLKVDSQSPYFEVNRKLSKLDNYYYDGVFDSEHYYRDGEQTPILLPDSITIAREKQNQSVDSSNRPIDENGNIIEETGNPDKGPGGICPKGYSKIIIST